MDSYYRFIFVGRYDGLPRYYAQIRALISEFHMLPDRFWFTGPVPDEDLAAFYRWADVYVSLSEHEGFCVPLVEAMAADVPVLAYAAGAVPETLGGAGVLFAPKDLELAAEMLGHARVRSASARSGDRGTAAAAGGLRAGSNRAERHASRNAIAELSAWQLLTAPWHQHEDRFILKIAFIVQRYGTEILGGSEYHCRLIAERLAPRHHVEVLTTCAQDYITWKNDTRKARTACAASPSAGSRTRARATSTPSTAIPSGSSTTRTRREDEMEWLRQQGPWCPPLLEYIERNQHQYDVLIFFTYLYAPTVLGAKIAPQKSILVPTAHDEPAIHLDIYKELFSLPAGWPTTPTSSAGF